MGTIDVGEYCRQVEDHLTRVNGGHLVRVVGAGFELVRRWADAGVPLSVVCRGIDLKADRHRLGQSKRPLRIEFCEADVREVFDGWKRAVGVSGAVSEAAGDATDEAHAPKAPSLSKTLDRVIERLVRVSGRLDLPASFHAAIGEVLEEAVALRESARGARGPAKDALREKLPPLDRKLMAAARLAVPPEQQQSVSDQAARDLETYRDRLSDSAWQQAMSATVTRLVRDHFALPTIGD